MRHLDNVGEMPSWPKRSPSGTDGASSVRRDMSTSPQLLHQPSPSLPRIAATNLRTSRQSEIPSLACLSCHQRKIRCEKNRPCSSCCRSRVPCVNQVSRGKRRCHEDDEARLQSREERKKELLSRLSRLEDRVDELGEKYRLQSGQDLSAGHTQLMDSVLDLRTLIKNQASTPGTRIGSNQTPESASMSGLTDCDMPDVSLSRPQYSELDKLGPSGKTGIDAHFTKMGCMFDSSPAKTLSSKKFAYSSADVDLREYHPNPTLSTFLWSTYKSNVESLIKALHVPTAELLMNDARLNKEKILPENQALVFAIYFAAIISLDEHEVRTYIGGEKEDLLRKYRFALEQSLAQANFLRTTNIEVAQALVIFLISVSRRAEDRFCWSMTGLTIRIAQAMGLHRDGEFLGLSPFQTEIRRRIWWLILVLDLRSADGFGSNLAISDDSYDTRVPSDINDADICPTSTKCPQPRNGWSDCTLCTMRCEVFRVARNAFQYSSTVQPSTRRTAHQLLKTREEMLFGIYQHVEHKFLRRISDEVQPLYCASAFLGRAIMARMRLLLYQTMLSPDMEDTNEEIRQRIFVAAIDSMECNDMLIKSRVCKPYRWIFKPLKYSHVITYLLLESCRRAWTPLVERGWNSVKDGMDSVETEFEFEESDRLHLPKLFLRTQRHRAKQIAYLKANKAEFHRLETALELPENQVLFSCDFENGVQQMKDEWRRAIQLEEVLPAPSSALSSPLPSTSSYDEVPRNDVGLHGIVRQDWTPGNMSTQQQTPNLTMQNDPLQYNISISDLQPLADLVLPSGSHNDRVRPHPPGFTPEDRKYLNENAIHNSTGQHQPVLQPPIISSQEGIQTTDSLLHNLNYPEGHPWAQGVTFDLDNLDQVDQGDLETTMFLCDWSFGDIL